MAIARSAERLPHIVTAYALAVVAGDIVAGLLVRRACKRHLFDLDRGKDPKSAYVFDTAAADRAIRFFGLLKQSKGQWRGQPLKLSTWQKFIVGSVFGWKRRDTGKRRFRTVYEEVARKNGKTTKIAGIGLYCLLADGEGGAEVYSAATKRDQAKLCWAEAKRMAQKSPRLRRRLKLKAGALECPGNDGIFVPLGADADTMDGLNPSCGLVDEVHKHKKRDVWDVFDTALGARDQPILWAITTAAFGSDESSLCYDLNQYTCRVLEDFDKPDGLIDETWFGYIATIDEGDDWRDPSVWIKANPNLGISVSLEELTQKCAQAQAVPSRQNAFKRLRLDIWTEQEDLWIPMEVWDRNGSPFDVGMLEGRDCHGGLDVSAKIDLSGLVLTFPPADDDPMWYQLYFPFIPSKGIERRELKDDKVPFRAWAEQGHLTITDGDGIDQNVIKRTVLEATERFNIIDIGFDPWSAHKLSSELIDEGVDMVEMRQGIATFADPSAEFERLLYAGRLAHGGHPVARWMARNVAIRFDENENFMPAKRKSKDRIDLIVAGVMSIGRALATDTGEGPSVYETRGLVTI